ncbi:uncharacterized protein BJ171DRAFT_50783 [Polychytrium aggregatum]|uniref:uncharacterized protein n=1 Tax=Polychytrium aggregatum TaxID=110093 RepID=UPI0022FECDCA|nr:uncharacterized protein BJ171DRAFT_50783 [Polychytrium aggregatum]KAI9205710.1 hypothetical protein BJ171DRAFT_50783 [Polychytrium aggregatum]
MVVCVCWLACGPPTLSVVAICLLPFGVTQGIPIPMHPVRFLPPRRLFSVAAPGIGWLACPRLQVRFSWFRAPAQTSRIRAGHRCRVLGATHGQAALGFMALSRSLAAHMSPICCTGRSMPPCRWRGQYRKACFLPPPVAS